MTTKDTKDEAQERKDFERMFKQGEAEVATPQAASPVEKRVGVGSILDVRSRIQALKEKLAQGSKSDLDAIGAHLDALVAQIDAVVGAAQ